MNFKIFALFAAFILVAIALKVRSQETVPEADPGDTKSNLF